MIRSLPWRAKLKAFGAHLLISAVVFTIIIVLAVWMWYPPPLYWIDGGPQITLLAALVDIIAGPLLTLIVYRPHKPRLVMNLVVIALTMAPSFRRSFTPPIPTGLLNSYYVLAAVHAGLGTVAELLGLYIFVVAGTNILPKRLRFTRYKPWMRTALALWWLVLLLGVATYLRWYVAPLL